MKKLLRSIGALVLLVAGGACHSKGADLHAHDGSMGQGGGGQTEAGAGGIGDSGETVDGAATGTDGRGGLDANDSGGVGTGGKIGSGGIGNGGIGNGGNGGPAQGNGGADAFVLGSGGTGGGAGGAGGSIVGTGGTDGAVAVNDRCANPQRVDFVNGQITISDNTSRGSDEFPTLVCGGPVFAGPLTGRQLYYRFTVRAGMKYEIRLQLINGDDPDIFYVFPASSACTVDAIQAACKSGGKTGTAPTTPGTLTTFVPSDPGDYIVAVDTDFVGSGGPFTLNIFEHCGDSNPTGCLPETCTPSLVGTCNQNLLSICADGTGYVTNDCAANGFTCFNGACHSTVVDSVGYTQRKTQPTIAGTTGASAFNFFSLSTNRTLTEINQLRYQGSAIPLTWVVFEATSQTGPYGQIFSKSTTSNAASSGAAESSGPIRVSLVAGRTYAIGVVMVAGAIYDVAQEQISPLLPEATFFGQLISATNTAGPPPLTNVPYAAPSTFVFPQRLTTTL